MFAASRGSSVARYPDGTENFEWGERPWSEADGPEWVTRYRLTGVIITMAVIAMGFEMEDWPTIGPRVDETRTLRGAGA